MKHFSAAALQETAPTTRYIDDEAHHALIVIRDARTRQTIIRQLEEAAFRVTVVPSLAIADALADHEQNFDLLVTVQSLGEMAHFGLPQLARSIHPELPILLLDTEAARGTGIASAALEMVDRWPLRQRAERRIH